MAPICSNRRDLPAEFALRVATPADAAAVSGVLKASYGALYRGWYRDDVLKKALPAMTAANPRLLASGRYYVVEIDGRAVACGGFSHEAPGSLARTPGLAHLRHFATHPDYLARGAGGAILEKSLVEAAKEGATSVEVMSSLTAEAFYASHDFVPVGAVHVPMGGVPFACVLMRRAIAQTSRF